MVRLIVVLLGLLASGVVSAGDGYPEQMEYHVFYPCRGSASFCGPQVLTRGPIDSGAPARLAALLVDQEFETVAFDSPGGSLTAGLKLGVLIREKRLNTLVASAYQEEMPANDDSESQFHTIASDAGCFSACAYAFMGGVGRTVEEGGRIGVHQFYGPASQNDEARAQIAMASLSRYMKDMGIDRDLLDIASLTVSEEMTEIPRQYAVQYNLDNQFPPLASWKLVALNDGQPAVVVKQQRAGSDSVTSLVIATWAKSPRTSMVVVRRDSLAPETNRAVLAYLPKPGSFARLCAGDECAVLRLGPAWKIEDGALQGAFTASTADLLTLSRGSSIRLDVDFPNAASDIDPSISVGGEGLRQGMLSVVR